MNLKEQATKILRECDFINDEIQNLKKREQAKRIEISLIKKNIENEHKYLIGKKAMCSNADESNFKNIECICNALMCNDSFDIIPLFSHKGKRVSVDTFNWL